MRIPFEKMPENARIWVYQANRAFDQSEEKLIQGKVERFLESWAAHGAELTTAYEIRYKRFLFIAVDEASVPPSGCSIDASVRVLKEINSILDIDFLDRMRITFKEEDQVKDLSISDFKGKIQADQEALNLMVFNNLIGKKSELSNWEIPLKDSWHKQWL